MRYQCHARLYIHQLVLLSNSPHSHRDLRQRGKENEVNIMDKQISTQSALLSSAGSDSFNFSNPNQSYKKFTDEWIGKKDLCYHHSTDFPDCIILCTGGKVGPCRSLFARTKSGTFEV